MSNFKRFIMMYVILTIISMMFGDKLTTYLLVYNIGMAAFCCLFGDILEYIIHKPAKKGE